MNQKVLSIAGVVLVALLILVFLGFKNGIGPAPSISPNETVSTSTAFTDTGASSSNTSKKPSSSPTSSSIPSTKTRDSMTALPLYGTIPFTVKFSLTLNTDLKCQNDSYILSFGDNIDETLQVPSDACTKTYIANISHQYTHAGTFVAVLSSKLIGGGAGQELAHLTIEAKNQSVTIGKTAYGTFTISPPAGTVPLDIAITLSATDSNSANGINYTVSFGDGETETFPQIASPALTHTYTHLGSYYITVNRRTECIAGACAGPSTSLGSYNISVH